MSFTTLLLLLIVVAMLFTVARSAKRRQVETRQEQQLLESQLTTSRKAADEDVTKFGEELQRLDSEVAGHPLDAEMQDDYTRALDAYDNAKQSLDAVQNPDEIRNVTAILEDGRYSIACVKARVDNQPLPRKLPPCFFDPAHGPSIENVSWAPAGGATRDVPACESCAQRVAVGAQPNYRTVMDGSKRVPYWEGGQAYAPWAQGYYSRWSGSNLIADVMLTSMIFNTMSMMPWMVGGLASGIGEGFGEIGSGVGDAFGGVGDGLADGFGEIGDGLGNLGEGLADGFGEIGDFLGGLFD